MPREPDVERGEPNGLQVTDDWRHAVDVDAVLAGQGFDPRIVCRQNPASMEAARQALEEGEDLVKPAFACRYLDVLAVAGDRVELENGADLAGPLVARQLAEAEQVAAVICTIGPATESRAAAAMADDPLFGFALDGFGTAAVEAVATAVCRAVEARAAARLARTSAPMCPGMIGWPLDEGQRQLFALVDATQLGVRLTASAQMVPCKSLSMVIGIGRDLPPGNSTCNWCGMAERCRYRGRGCAGRRTENGERRTENADR